MNERQKRVKRSIRRKGRQGLGKGDTEEKEDLANKQRIKKYR